TLSKNLDLSLNVSYTESVSAGSATFPSDNLNPGGTRNAIYPYAELMDEAGNALVVPKNLNLAFADTAGAGKLLDWKYRPLEAIENASSDARSGRITANRPRRYSLVEWRRAERL